MELATMNPWPTALAVLLVCLSPAGCGKTREGQITDRASLVAPGAELERVAGGFEFTEGPTVDAEGNVAFTDIPNNRIHRWSVDGELAILHDDTGGANGLCYAKNGDLYACEAARRRVIAIDRQGNVSLVADRYEGRPFNGPNDLWIDPKGGVYFTDAGDDQRRRTGQAGNHVYYVAPDRKRIVRVCNDYVRPNGIVGTADGKRLYISDRRRRKTFVYAIEADGTLSEKTLFCRHGSDGMTRDQHGNVYLTTWAVLVFNPDGKRLATIRTPKPPSNVCFAGRDGKTLVITARDSVYALAMNVDGQAGRTEIIEARARAPSAEEAARAGKKERFR
jgi:gluconolactonase